MHTGSCQNELQSRVLQSTGVCMTIFMLMPSSIKPGNDDCQGSNEAHCTCRDRHAREGCVPPGLMERVSSNGARPSLRLSAHERELRQWQEVPAGMVCSCSISGPAHKPARQPRRESSLQNLGLKAGEWICCTSPW